MGQQQLLLVILVTIIVGIATVVAINIFGTASEQANKDAVRQDLLAATVQAQGIWAKPTQLGGAGRDFTSITPQSELLEALSIPGQYTPVNNPTQVDNENGTYSLNGVESSSITIDGVASSDGATIQAIVCRDSTAQVWRVDIGEGTADDPCSS